MPLLGVLFDLDDTLFDHEHATLTALAALRTEEPAFAGWSADEFAARHSVVLEAMHLEVLAGHRSIEDARAERFRRLIEAAGGEPAAADRATAVAWRYRAAYEAAWQPVAGARELLAALGEAGLRVGIVTNNSTAEQEQKLQRCGLAPLVDALVTSEGVGVAKPARRIFDEALDRLRLAAAQAVMVGDAWRTDIEGAAAAGIRPVWFNRRRGSSPNPDVAELAALEPTHHALRIIRGIEADAAG